VTWLIVEEAGDVGFSAGSSRYFLVIVLVTDDIVALRRAVTRTRKQLRRKLKNIPEFKAFKTAPRVIRRLLTNALASDWSVIASIVDKSLLKRQDDSEELYRRVAVAAIQRATREGGTFSAVFDKRYTNWRQWQQLTDALSAALELPERLMLTIRQEESEKEKAIQVADAIAWALFQKYEREDEGMYQLIRERIAVEEMWRK